MRFVPSMFERVSGQFIGEDNRTNGRVTIEPSWLLNKTPPIYGSGVRGPYRWWQDQADSGVEWEVPNIATIDWDRSEDQDIASCTITLYNMWHERNDESPELLSQLGKPGYFWPKRGMNQNRWNQSGGKGAFRKDGFWDPNFSWQNVLVPFGLIRTYEGYGGHHTPTEYKSVNQNLEDENVLQTGTWIIENVTAGSDGMLTLSCKDIGVLLLKEFILPPLVPDGAYPVNYIPPGKSPFDSFFGTKPSTGVSPASFGEVHKKYHTSSLDVATGVPNTSVGGHIGSHICDGSWDTYGLTEAYATPTGGQPFFQIDLGNEGISKLALKPWAGGYRCYVSIRRSGAWRGSKGIPGSGFPYVTYIDIPLSVPDGLEDEIYIEIPTSFYEPGVKFARAEYVRLTFENLYYSGIPDSSGNYYRAGVRDVTFYREGAKVNPYSADFATLPWTFSMASHPTRGYWVLDSNGTVHGFGDAANYDSTRYGPVPISSVHPDNKAIAIKGHPDGKGYWVLDITGRVYAYGESEGSAKHYGEVVVPWPGTQIWGHDGMQAWDIAPTHTGNGYWVIYGNGVIHGFGDAVPNYTVLPWTAVGLYMSANVNPRYFTQRHGNGVCGHPTKMGFWATTGSGEVFAYGACKHYGQLKNRVYNPGMADQFRLTTDEFTKSIESTTSGNGYWIAFGSGHIAAFGDAINQGKTFIYEGVPNFDIDFKTIQDAGLWSFFRSLVWSIARDPDGTGFWVLLADGSVGHYNAEFWGSPGYLGKTGWRWHEGNFDGDYMSIIKELLAWAGWTFYAPGSATLDIFGELESTGIVTDSIIQADKFDKRPVLDVIKEICEVVGYLFQIREDGGVRVTSRNIWRSGNFDEDGQRIYVKGNSLERVPSTHEDATEFIPLIDEDIDLFNYTASLNGDTMRSEIIIGAEVPDKRNPSSTAFIRHTPVAAKEQLRPGVPAMRNIPSPAIWTSSLFENKEEMKIMAELIDLNAWFSSRTGEATCVANPCLGIGTQVKFAERNTGEYNIHYIRGIKSSHNVQEGVWEMTLTTHWLGDKDNWVITADNVNAPVNGLHFFQISEALDRWQQVVGLGLEKGAQSRGWSALSNIVTAHGEFDRTSIGLEEYEDQDKHWRLNGTLTVYRRFDQLRISVEAQSDPLGDTAFLEIKNSDDNIIYTVELSDRYVDYPLPALGVNNERTDYTFSVYGYPGSTGSGQLIIAFKDGTSFKASVADTVLVVG